MFCVKEKRYCWYFVYIIQAQDCVQEGANVIQAGYRNLKNIKRSNFNVRKRLIQTEVLGKRRNDIVITGRLRKYEPLDKCLITFNTSYYRIFPNRSRPNIKVSLKLKVRIIQTFLGAVWDFFLKDFFSSSASRFLKVSVLKNLTRY